MINEAIQQLQRAQQNPQRRIRSFYYLALCFKQKNQFDIAAEQLEKAASELQHHGRHEEGCGLRARFTILEAMGQVAQKAPELQGNLCRGFRLPRHHRQNREVSYKK
jgi:hypothetical protein